MAVEVEATWQYRDGVDLVPVDVATDADSPTGKALPVIDGGTRTALATAITRLTSILAAVDGMESNTTGLALDATLTSVLAAVDGLEALLSTIDADTSSLAAEDFATQATLELVRAAVDGLEALLATIDADTSNLDVALSTRATEVTLEAVRAAVDGLEANTTGLGLEATLQALLTELGQKLEPGGPVDTGLVIPAEFPLPAGQVTTLTAKQPDVVGTWGYVAGASGTPTITGSKRVTGIAAHATTAGSFTINGGDSIPVPANSSIEIQPLANLVDPAIVFTGTDSFFVETVV